MMRNKVLAFAIIIAYILLGFFLVGCSYNRKGASIIGKPIPVNVKPLTKETATSMNQTNDLIYGSLLNYQKMNLSLQQMPVDSTLKAFSLENVHNLESAYGSFKNSKDLVDELRVQALELQSQNLQLSKTVDEIGVKMNQLNDAFVKLKTQLDEQKQKTTFWRMLGLCSTSILVVLAGLKIYSIFSGGWLAKLF